MNEEEYEKILEDLYQKRISNKKLSQSKITPQLHKYQSSVLMDFASLYPSTVKIHFPTKQSRRKKRIQKVFDL